MHVPSLPDDYRMSLPEAAALQRRLAAEVRLEPLAGPVRFVAGVDVSSEWHGSLLSAAVVVFAYPSLTPVESVFAEHESAFPYVPGFLSFREIPALLKAFAQLRQAPDVLFVDGQGITHPRRLGIAAHLGVLLDLPSVGVAKSSLYGSWQEPVRPGDGQPILDPRSGELLGTAFKSKARSKPILVSPGHRITHDEALALVRSMLQGYRLPITTRAAHDAVNAYRRSRKAPATGDSGNLLAED
ncbi:deoxyribonuclease V [Chitinimonas koreensis]|uniref:deoxyribonuclease V n=1 Tax=Chitinimonas koreensis TaxID=356302 RepID=UPI00042A05B9|nr:deoxyribonuclease V [Chitinimonas koreensis]QNM96644.1 endonuclease V [Chitinimonas koreensis]